MQYVNWLVVHLNIVLYYVYMFTAGTYYRELDIYKICVTYIYVDMICYWRT